MNPTNLHHSLHIMHQTLNPNVIKFLLLFPFPFPIQFSHHGFIWLYLLILITLNSSQKKSTLFNSFKIDPRFRVQEMGYWKNPFKEVTNNSKPLFLTVYGIVLIGIFFSAAYVFSAVYSPDSALSWRLSQSIYLSFFLSFTLHLFSTVYMLV